MSFDFLTEMAWKSALIGGAALLLAALLARRSAGERSAVLRTGLAAILLLPLISLLLPALPVVTGTIHESSQALPLGDVPLSAAIAPEPAGAWDDPTPLIVLAWIGGLVMVLLRLGVGLATLSRWTRGGSKVNCPEWRGAFSRALGQCGIGRPVRLLASDAPSPMSWGWLKPVILLDRDTLRDGEEADAVLAHELAHVVRRDWLTLVLARLVVALFWFNPLMWLLERRLVAEAEEAADARALEHVEPGRYAQTLLSCAQQFNGLTVPAAGMADAGLARRVKAILDRRLRAGAPDPRRVRAAILLCALVAAPIAALKPVEAVVRDTNPPVAPAAPAAPPPVAAPAAPPAPAAAPATPSVPGAPDAPAAPAAPVALAALVQPAQPPRPPLAPMAVMPLAAMAPVAPPAPPMAPRPPRDGNEYWSEEDSREIARAVREAVAEAGRAGSEAMAEAGRARAEAMRDVARARDDAQRAGQMARLEARRGVAAGADGMEAGARGMEDGARQMELEADKLRSENYRREQIGRQARQGRTVTDQELLASIPRLHAGAEKMRRGAERMRAGAARMRAGRTD